MFICETMAATQPLCNLYYGLTIHSIQYSGVNVYSYTMLHTLYTSISPGGKKPRIHLISTLLSRVNITYNITLRSRFDLEDKTQETKFKQPQNQNQNSELTWTSEASNKQSGSSMSRATHTNQQALSMTSAITHTHRHTDTHSSADIATSEFLCSQLAQTMCHVTVRLAGDWSMGLAAICIAQS